MSLKIRLARAGSKKRPYYHIVVADARAPRDGRFIERIGAYNPMLAKDSADRVTFDAERAKHWLGVGAKATDRVARFFDAEGLLKREARNNPNKAEPGQKARDRAESRAEAKAAAAAPAPVEEAPAEASVAEAPVEPSKAEETPAQQTPAEEAPAEEAKAQEAPAAEAPAE